MGCFSGRLMSAASYQKLFCELCSLFNCSFDEFVGEKVVSPSYSSAILVPPPMRSTFMQSNSWEMDEAQAGLKLAGRNINNLRYADDTTLMAKSEEEPKSLLMKVERGE